MLRWHLVMLPFLLFYGPNNHAFNLHMAVDRIPQVYVSTLTLSLLACYQGSNNFGSFCCRCARINFVIAGEAMLP
jgi:hypothetical protein